jgi:hypothetical protein
VSWVLIIVFVLVWFGVTLLVDAYHPLLADEVEEWLGER